MWDRTPYKVGPYTVYPMPEERMRALVTRSAVYFALCRVAGKTLAEAREGFRGSALEKAFGLELTVGDVWAFEEAAGYKH